MSKLKLLPLQIIEKNEKIILKRGVSSIVLNNSNALVAIKVINDCFMEGARTKEELLELFSGNTRESVGRLIDGLINKRFIIEDTADIEQLDSWESNIKETPQDIFYWHFNQCQSRVSEILNSELWVFVGVNELTKALIKALVREHKVNYLVVDDPCLRNIKFFDLEHSIVDAFWYNNGINVISKEKLFNLNNIGLIVAAVEFGSFHLMSSWNDYAIKNSVLFYPLTIKNMIGYAGPLVVNNSSCLTCFRLRQDSNMNDFVDRLAIDEFAYEGQEIISYHSSMLNALAEIGVFELIRFKLNINWEMGSICEISLLGNSMVKRKVMKVPRCPSCSTLNSNPSINLHKRLTSEAAWKELEQVE